MSTDAVRAIADAVLYEGYILWPYRRSAMKNQQRFTFGGVYPPAHARRHPDDPSLMQSEVLLRGGQRTRLEVSVRFLHVVRRTVMRRTARGLEPVDELRLDGERYLSWEEAAERELAVPDLSLAELLKHEHTTAVRLAGGSSREPLRAGSGTEAGALMRSWERLDATIAISVTPVAADLFRVRVRVRNRTRFKGAERGAALAQTMCSTHALLTTSAGEFVSLTDPPPGLARTAAACRNRGCWPVLVGEPGQTGQMLCAPIILEDYPRIAPESPGDLFDGGEIDQLLVLNILALTDEEKAEMAASDPRAREILERTEALRPDQLMRLHGVVREFGMVR